MIFRNLTLIIFAVVLSQGAWAVSSSFDRTISGLQKEWAYIHFKTPVEVQPAAYEKLLIQVKGVAKKNSKAAEPLILEALILTTHAGTIGGIEGFNKVKDAKELLDTAEKINPKAMEGTVYTALGNLYYEVPSWPIGFGDTEKAEQYLKKALDLNPKGINANYFYGDFLVEQGRYEEAIIYLTKASKGKIRKSNRIIDEGRRKDARSALKRAIAEQNEEQLDGMEGDLAANQEPPD